MLSIRGEVKSTEAAQLITICIISYKFLYTFTSIPNLGFKRSPTTSSHFESTKEKNSSPFISLSF